MLSHINTTNQKLYIQYLSKFSNILKNNGYKLMVTLDPKIKEINDKITFEQLDYASLAQLVDNVVFLQYAWGMNTSPPMPVSSNLYLQTFLEYVVNLISPSKITVGIPLLGYDWELPYEPQKTTANALTLNSAISLASDVNATIQFDETSQTPFYNYTLSYTGKPIEHIVWFIDARSTNSLLDLVDEFKLLGTGLWNTIIYNQQLWTVINCQYEIVNVLPVNFS
jgi:spore germination protein